MQPDDKIFGEVTLEDLARAWASMDGKLREFDAERGMSPRNAVYGHYLGYLVEAREILERAEKYAEKRRS